MLRKSNHDLSNIIKAFGSKEPFKKACTYDLVFVPEVPLWLRSCTSELQLKVNCRPKVNYRIKIVLARPAVGRPAQMFSYN